MFGAASSRTGLMLLVAAVSVSVIAVSVAVTVVVVVAVAVVARAVVAVAVAGVVVVVVVVVVPVAAVVVVVLARLVRAARAGADGRADVVLKAVNGLLPTFEVVAVFRALGRLGGALHGEWVIRRPVGRGQGGGADVEHDPRDNGQYKALHVLDPPED